MSRFLKDTDYNFQVKNEILKLLDGSTAELASSVKLLSAENAAIAQMKNRLSGRFATDIIFAGAADPDPRDSFIIMIAVDITLYHLYSQTGNKDVPKHRADRYQDAIDFLKDASNGTIATNLPSALTDTNQGDLRMWSQYEADDHNY